MTSASSEHDASDSEAGVSWVEKVGGFQSGGSEGTRSSGKDVSLKGGTIGVAVRLVFIAVAGVRIPVS